MYIFLYMLSYKKKMTYIPIFMNFPKSVSPILYICPKTVEQVFCFVIVLDFS